jgi:cobyrinic acid a,c-diamide synthase
MTGYLRGKALMTEKLNRFGYITLTAAEDNLLCPAGDKINAHEFHYADSTDNGSGFIAAKPLDGRKWNCVHATENLYAGYPHLHLWGNISFAYSFLDQCRKYKKNLSQTLWLRTRK